MTILRPLTIYVSAKWEDRDRARDLMQTLAKAGHYIAYDWTTVTDATPAQAQRDLDGVRKADVFVMLVDIPQAWAGAWVEFGIALERGIPILLYGDHGDNCIFTLLPTVKRCSWGLVNLLQALWTISTHEVLSPA